MDVFGRRDIIAELDGFAAVARNRDRIFADGGEDDREAFGRLTWPSPL
jgi:hypothetical protein